MKLFQVKWIERKKLLCKCCDATNDNHEWFDGKSDTYEDRKVAEDYYHHLLEDEQIYREIKNLAIYEVEVVWKLSNSWEQ